MASNAELRSFFTNAAVRNKVTASTIIAATNELTADPGSVDGRAWALDVLRTPERWGEITYMAVLSANKGNSAAEIEGASDADIQSAVDNVVASLITAHAGA